MFGILKCNTKHLKQDGSEPHNFCNSNWCCRNWLDREKSGALFFFLMTPQSGRKTDLGKEKNQQQQNNHVNSCTGPQPQISQVPGLHLLAWRSKVFLNSWRSYCFIQRCAGFKALQCTGSYWSHTPKNSSSVALWDRCQPHYISSIWE